MPTRRGSLKLALAAAIAPSLMTLILNIDAGFPSLTAVVLLSTLWVGGLTVLWLGRSWGFYVALVSGFLLVNFRLLAVLPQDLEKGLWLAESVALMLGYAISVFEASPIWRGLLKK